MVRPLSKELQKIAIEELNEDPERVKEDIKEIRDWIKQQVYLKARTDDQWILGFLRGCKFNLERTKERFDRHYTLKSLIPNMTQIGNVDTYEIQAILKAGIILPLPYSANHIGPRIILTRQNNLDTSIMNPENLYSVMYIILTILMIEDDNFIISGVLYWNDFSDFPFKFIPQFTPKIVRNILEILKNGFPLRTKGIHWSGSTEVAKKMLMVVKRYLGPKLKQRGCFTYGEDNFEDIFKVIPKSYMPKEYGGENSNVEEITAYWKNKVESYSTWFAENKQYGTIEAMRPGEPATLHEVIGIDGSFEKLNID